MSNRPLQLIAAALLALTGVVARADVGSQWTSIAVETSREARDAPDAAKRRLAIVQQAMGRARAATRHGNGNGNGNFGGAGPEREEAAVAVAAFAVLESLYPEQRENLDSRLALSLSYLPETQAKAEGAALGRRAAQDILRIR